MDLNGEEKRIQALFDELKSHDHRIAPSFARTWNIAQSRIGRSRSVKSLLTLPAFLATAVLICVVGVAIVLFSVDSRPAQQTQINTSKQLRNDAGGAFKPSVEVKSDEANSKPKTKPRNDVIRFRTMATKRTIARRGLPKIKSSDLSLWQSPTAGLLRFPGDQLLRTGPAVIQSAPELRSFLSHLN